MTCVAVVLPLVRQSMHNGALAMRCLRNATPRRPTMRPCRSLAIDSFTRLRYAGRMKRISIIAIIALTGCASTQSIMERAPNEVLTSTKAQADVAFCLGNRNNAPVYELGNGDKVIQVKSLVGVVGVSFVVKKDGEGSIVEVRKANSPVSIARVKECL